MNYSINKRGKCRLCDSRNLSKFMHFDNIPFFDEVVTPDICGKEFTYHMDLYFCNECKSVQTQHDVNLVKYYKTYQYIASNSNFVRDYMHSLVSYCKKNLGLKNSDKVIEIGAANGYLLSLFKQNGAEVLGFEAAQNLCEIANEQNIHVINELFTEKSLKVMPSKFRQVDFFILLHTFDHLYDPAPFLDLVVTCLNPKTGILLIEVHDFNDIYHKCETALFGHEHATYLHYDSMSRLLHRHGLRIVDFNFLDKNLCRGSSMLIAATPKDSSIKQLRDLNEFSSPKLDDLDSLVRFKQNVEHSFANLKNHVETGLTQGKKYVGYGGWGRGVTTLAMAKFTKKHLQFVVDGNAKLHGGFTPATKIPIKGPDSITIDTADEVIVFNYAYIDEIKSLLGDYIKSGGKVISVLDLLSIN